MKRAFDLITPMEIRALLSWEGDQTPKEIGLKLVAGGFAPGVWEGSRRAGPMIGRLITRGYVQRQVIKRRLTTGRVLIENTKLYRLTAKGIRVAVTYQPITPVSGRKLRKEEVWKTQM